MAITESAYARATLEAQLHVQLTVERVEIPRVTPGKAKVRGKLVRVFRGDPALLGREIEIAVDCYRQSDPPFEGGISTEATELEHAQVIETFLNADESGYVVAAWLSDLLEQPTDEPVRIYAAADAEEPKPDPAYSEARARTQRRRRIAWGAFELLMLVIWTALLLRIAA